LLNIHLGRSETGAIWCLSVELRHTLNTLIYVSIEALSAVICEHKLMDPDCMWLWI